MAEENLTAMRSATLTVTAGEKTENVTVSQDVRVLVTGVTLDKVTALTEVEATITLVATVTPSSATNRNVSWKSLSPAIASVNSSGEVTGVAEGIADIVVTTVDGGMTDTCTVTVLPTPEASVSVTFGSESWDAVAAAAVNFVGEDAVGLQAYKIAPTADRTEFPFFLFTASATGTTTYEDGADPASTSPFFVDYYEHTSLSEGQGTYGDWWNLSGTIEVTVTNNGVFNRMSGTANLVMFNAEERLVDDNEDYDTRSLTITFENMILEDLSVSDPVVGSDSFKSTLKGPMNRNGLKLTVKK